MSTIMTDLVQQAAARYRDVLAAPPEGLARAVVSPVEADAEDRRARRRARLNRTAASQTARSLVLAAEASTKARRSQQEVIESLSQERVIGTSDLMDVNFLELAIALSRGVGRVHLPNGYGTGFLVGPGLMMTNHHVIGTEDDAKQALFQLDYQDDASGKPLPVQSFKLNPGQFFVTHQALDFTITALEPTSDQGRSLESYPWIQLIGEIGKAEAGDPVNIIQHPRGGLKQIAFRENKVVSIPLGEPQFLYYTTDTEPGSSGSPCFNDQWELVALHHSGVAETDDQKHLLKKDHTAWHAGEDPALLNWIANEGIRVSAIAACLRNADLMPEWRDLIGRALTMRPPNPIELARSPAPGPEDPEQQGLSSPTPVKAAGRAERRADSFTWNIPLQVTVSLGEPAVPGITSQPSIPPKRVPTVLPAPAEPSEEVVRVDTNYKNREGYDPEFLGISIPLPEISENMKADTAKVPPDYQKHGDPYELAYHHYSVYMNKRRRTAWFSAANVDGKNRPDIGPRQGDKWYTDPRVSQAEQLGQNAFESGIDRGHLTRREDAAWGSDGQTALMANNDTFHFTNCALQASLFNRGKDRWQGLEQFLLEKHAKKEKQRMAVITGPLFAASDPVYQNENMDYSVRCALQYWKVCVLVRQDDSLSATAFLLGQEEIKDLPGFEEKAFDVAATQITIAELENRTGLKFGDLAEHDHFAQGGDPGTLEIETTGQVGKRRIKPIYRNEDVVV